MAILAVFAFSAAKAQSQYPLAAALVDDGKLYLVDLPTHSARQLPLGDLLADEADLSLDKSKVVVSASPKGLRHFGLYLLDVANGAIEKLLTGLTGNERFPRFANGDRSVVFTCASKPGADSHENPTRVHELLLGHPPALELLADPGHCQMDPVEVEGHALAFISTSCFVGYELERTAGDRQKIKRLEGLADPGSEVASSPDRKKLVFTNRVVGGRGFFVREGQRPARRLATLLTRTARLQPRFVCPRNLLFLNEHSVWTLDSESGKQSEILALEGAAKKAGRAQ
ncbi:MAG: TolB-like translocation protein [Deltaproteobacteria bacterium]